MKRQQRKKETGFIVTLELVFIATILVIGLVVGWVIVRDALTAELDDVAEAVGALDQSYQYTGIIALGDGTTLAIVSGSGFTDADDLYAGDDTVPVFTTMVTDGDEGGNLP
jgi:hypothetical protein